MNATWEIRCGGALKRLREMPAESVQTCITSPPYWGLRDYGTATWEGGDPDCEHSGTGRASDALAWHGSIEGAQPARGTGSPHRGGNPWRCRCGADRIDEQIGLEATPEEYVATLVAVFAEVHRVLRADGTLWLNLGDAYATRWGSLRPEGRGGLASEGSRMRRGPQPAGFKPKDLMGLPWAVATALRDAGWWLRSEIIWHKLTPMPESVEDRPTRAHEQLFLFAKQRHYFYDGEAIREPLKAKTWTTFGSLRRPPEDATDLVKASNFGRGMMDRKPRVNGDGDPVGANRRSVWMVNDPLEVWAWIFMTAEPAARLALERQYADWLDAQGETPSVWPIASGSFAAAHFATFPPALVEPCVLAGSSVEAAHGAEAEHGTVLDPFAGAGTTGLVALRYGRSFLGIELKADYCELARNRIRDDSPLLNSHAESPA